VQVPCRYYEVAVHPKLLEEEDGPMLDLLKDAHHSTNLLPRRRSSRPDRGLLAVRFERFRSAA
jgi:putative restriction endonuclease